MDVFVLAINSILGFALLFILDGILKQAIACWKATAPTNPAHPPESPLPVQEPHPSESPLPVQEPTPSKSPLPVQQLTPPKPLTYSQQVKSRASKMFGFEIKTATTLKNAVINHGDLSFMESVNLERQGRALYEAIDSCLDRIEKKRHESRRQSNELIAALAANRKERGIL